MYKVFFKSKVLLPGIQLPGNLSGEGLKMEGIPSPAALRASLHRLETSPHLSWLQYGLGDDPSLAWEVLKEITGMEYAAGGFVVGAGKFVLLIFRNGFWDLPKGKPKMGEDPPTTALRETREETGVSGLSLNTFLGLSHHVFDRDNKLILKENRWYIMECKELCTLEPQLDEGITRAIWVNNLAYQSLKPTFYPSLLEMAEEGWRWITSGKS